LFFCHPFRYRTRLANGGVVRNPSATIPSYYDDYHLSLPSSSSTYSSNHHHRSYFFEYPVGCCDSSHILRGNVKENSYWMNHLKQGDKIAVRWSKKDWKPAVVLTVMKDYDLLRMVKVSFNCCVASYCFLFISFSSLFSLAYRFSCYFAASCFPLGSCY
jgi:hypothetical protein